MPSSKAKQRRRQREQSVSHDRGRPVSERLENRDRHLYGRSDSSGNSEAYRTSKSRRRLNGGRVEKLPENAGYSTPGFRPADPGFQELFNPNGGGDGIFVNENTALNFSAIYSAITLIANAIATMPVDIVRRTAGGRETVTDHPAWRLLNVTPDGQRTSLLYKEASQAHVLLSGNTYSEIIRNMRGQAIDLHLIDPHRVHPWIHRETGVKYYNVTGPNGMDTLRNDQIMHLPALTWDGVTGMSPMKLARETILLGLYAQKYGVSFYEKGGRPMGFLTKPGVVGDTQRKQYRQEWKELHEGLSNWFSVGILSGGLSWENIGVTPDEAQFLSTREFQIEEVARWYHVPPHMLAQMKGAKYGNIDHMMLEFAIFTLLPWIKRWESELNMKLFTRVEQNTYSVKFNMSGLLRADPKTRAEVLGKQLGMGIITINEVREIEDRNAFADVGNKPLVMGSQMATLADVEAGINKNNPLKDKNPKATKSDNRLPVEDDDDEPVQTEVLDEVFATV